MDYEKGRSWKNVWSWLFIAGVLIVLIIAIAAGLHYFRAL